MDCFEQTSRWPRLSRGRVASLASCLVLTWHLSAFAQPAPAAPAQTRPEILQALLRAEPAPPFTLVYFNRPIVVLRSSVLGRAPQARAAGTVAALDDLVASGIAGPVEARPLGDAMLISVGSRVVLGLAAADIDDLSGETLPVVTALTVTRLRETLTDAAEAHSVRTMLRSSALAAMGFTLGCLALLGLIRARRTLASTLGAIAERRAARAGAAAVDVLRALRIIEIQRGVMTVLATIIGIIIVYVTSSFVLGRFAYTHPWGESMSGFLLATVETLSLSALTAIPNLFVVFLIFIVAKVSAGLVRTWFDAVQRGRVHVAWMYPETARATRRLVTAVPWLFGAVMAYPYLPGSQSEAFKGVSVFIGLMVTFGSSNLVNQIMSGFTLTYSRALRLGDFVRIGEFEGTVTHLGMLSAKLKTVWSEEVTVPNAVVIAQTTTNYSRLEDGEGVLTPTPVTIGYDVPWRQIEALLLLAAAQTPGLRQQPTPRVFQTALNDFYVTYTLLVSLQNQHARVGVLHELHANIQDQFNEHGVQIMSPNYVLDPAAPKVVTKDKWFAAPASPTSPAD